MFIFVLAENSPRYQYGGSAVGAGGSVAPSPQPEAQTMPATQCGQHQD